MYLDQEIERIRDDDTKTHTCLIILLPFLKLPYFVFFFPCKKKKLVEVLILSFSIIPFSIHRHFNSFVNAVFGNLSQSIVPVDILNGKQPIVNRMSNISRLVRSQFQITGHVIQMVRSRSKQAQFKDFCGNLERGNRH